MTSGVTTTRLLRSLCAAAVVLACASCGDPVDTAGPRRPNRSPNLFKSPAPQPTEALPKCRFPKEKTYPEWVPGDLPLPEGTYAYQNLPPLGGYKRALFVVRLTTQELTKLVLDEWKQAGYALGRGDAEPGEVEALFRKPPAVGAFKANDVFCDPGYSIMYLIWAPEGATDTNLLPTPTSTGSPLKS